MFDIKSISRANLFSWVLTILLTSGFFTVFFIYQKILDFRRNAESLQKSFVQYKKEIIKNEVQNAVRYINCERTAAKDAENPAILKRKILDRLREIKFGRRSFGDIFVIDSRGFILMHPDASREGKKFEEGGKKLLERSASGRFVGYQSMDPYLHEAAQTWVYAEPFTPLDWIVCSRLGDNEIRKAFAENRDRLKIDLVLEIVFICVLALIVTSAALIFSYSFTGVIKKEIDLIVRYFKDSVRHEASLSENDLHFSEFKFIAHSAVDMVAQIKELLQRVKDLAIKAEMGNQAKSGYLISMSHQFRSPINGVMGMAHILLDTDLREEQKEYVRGILSSGQSLVDLIGDIGDFALMETDSFEIARKPFNLSKIGDAVMELFLKSAADKNLKLDLVVEKETPLYFIGDFERIKQALTVLVRNAMMFTAKGGVEIRVSRISEKENSAVIGFRVVDTGPGISAEKLGTIFDFTHDEGTKSRKYVSVRLSLAVCKSLIEAMGGSINVESVKGKGTIFSFTLPLDLAKEESLIQKVKEEEAAAKVPKSFDGVRVLLAEDDSVNRSVAVKFFAKLGILADVAVNGTEALKKFKAGSYDIVFMDCEMPDLDGFAATKAIREFEGTSKHAPVIAMTAYAMRGDKDQCFEAGMDDHIAKPVSMDALTRMIEKHLNKPSSNP